MQGSCEKCESSKCCPISRKGIKFGFAFAVPNAIFLFVLGWAGWLFGYGLPVIDLFSSVYRGFGPTFWGGFAGGVWGFILGFIYGYIFGLIVKCCSGGHCCGKCTPMPGEIKK